MIFKIHFIFSKITQPLGQLTPLWAKSGRFKLARPSFNVYSCCRVLINIYTWFIQHTRRFPRTDMTIIAAITHICNIIVPDILKWLTHCIDKGRRISPTSHRIINKRGNQAFYHFHLFNLPDQTDLSCQRGVLLYTAAPPLTNYRTLQIYTQPQPKFWNEILLSKPNAKKTGSWNNFMYPPQFPSNIYNIYGVSVKQLKLPIFDVKCNLSAQEEDWRVGEWFSGS